MQRTDGGFHDFVSFFFIVNFEIFVFLYLKYVCFKQLEAINVK